jgi:hypothetical protein
MSEPTAFALSQLFTDLIGRKVSFAQTVASPETSIKQIYGIYRLLPQEAAVVVKADLALLGSVAGVMVGLPDAAVKERLKTAPIDDLLADAIHEVLNIASTVVVTEGRAVFQRMAQDRTYVDGNAGAVLKKPGHRSYFNVAVEGYQGGKFAILAPFLPSMPLD